MIKFEKKLIDWAEKHMLLLAALFLTALAILIRRQNIWFYGTDYLPYFDMHQGNIQSMSYWLIVRLLGYVAYSPLHGVKWLAGLSDIVVAVFCVLLLRKYMEKLPLLFAYAACLFAPVIYLSGCVLARVDSVAALFLLAGACLLQRQKYFPAIILMGVGMAIQPVFAIPAIVAYRIYEKKDKSGRRYLWLGAVGIAVLIEIVCSVFLRENWWLGVMSFFRWMMYHPYTGEVYQNAGEWLWQVLLMSGYGLAFGSIWAAFRRKIPFIAAVLVQFVVCICYGVVQGW